MTIRKRSDLWGQHLPAYARVIRELREDHDLTQAQIAGLLNVGQRTYADYELNRIRIPVDALIKLAEYYDVDMNYICGITKEKAPFKRSR